MKTIREIQQEMLDAFLQAGQLDLAEWIRRYPERREGIIDYRIRLELVAGDEEDNGVIWDDGGVLHNLVAQHCQTLALGEAWAQDAVADDDDDALEKPEPSLAAALERVRSEPHRKPNGKPYERVCVFTWCVGELIHYRGEASRLGVNKITYLLERALDLDLFDHRKQPFGPYDRMLRHGTEPIAEKSEYIRIVDRHRYEAFELGASANKALEYAPRYLRSEDSARALVAHLISVTRNDFELETWATVHWIAQEIGSRGDAVTPLAIQTALKNDPKWAEKLTRSNFHVSVITRALQDLRSVGLLPRG